jgi:hypothetical protein
MLKPSASMTANVPISETGTAASGMIDARAGLHDDVAELLLIDQPALGIDLEIHRHRRAYGLLANAPSGDLDILLANGCDHVARRQAPRRDLVRIEPYRMA